MHTAQLRIEHPTESTAMVPPVTSTFVTSLLVRRPAFAQDVPRSCRTLYVAGVFFLPTRGRAVRGGFDGREDVIAWRSCGLLGLHWLEREPVSVRLRHAERQRAYRDNKGAHIYLYAGRMILNGRQMLVGSQPA